MSMMVNSAVFAVAGSGPHAYWRARILTDAGRTGGGHHFANVGEIQFFDATGAKLATSGGTPLDSGHFNGSTNDAAKAVDASFSTLWSGDTDGLYGVGGHPTTVYLGYQFTSPQSVAFIAFSSQDVDAYAIDYSDDGSGWTQLTASPSFGLHTDTAHRYWRYRQLRAQTTQQPDAAEIEWRATPGGSNQTGSGTATSSSDLGGFPKSNAYDGNTATFWVSNNTNPGESWIGYDFGSGQDKKVNEFKLRIRNDAFGPAEAARDFLIECSDDATAWSLKWAVLAEAAWSAGEVRTYTNPGY